MNPKVTQATTIKPYFLRLDFANGEQRLFDVTPFLEKGIFRELKQFSYFKQVKVVAGSVQWPHGQDFSYDTLYIKSKHIEAAG